MALEQEVNPLSQFMYSLKAPETRRQWPQRLKRFIDFLKIEGDLDRRPVFLNLKLFHLYHLDWCEVELVRVFKDYFK